MQMIKYSTTLALALALASAGDIWAQEADPTAPPDLPENPTPSDFLPKSQIVPVAEQGLDEDANLDAGNDIGPPVESDEQLMLREFELFKQLIQEGVFDEADTVAKRLVEMTLRTKGPQSNEFAKALTNLAIVQFQTEEYDASKQNFESAIEIIEDIEDRLNAQLINPLKGLGAAQLESGRPDQASVTFQRAVHVSHVNEGPHNLEQIGLLESLAETHLRMGDLETAKEAQDTIYALNIRAYQLDTIELVPALMRRAAWQHRAGFIYDERTTYRRVVRIFETQISRDAIELIEPLIMLGKSFFFVDTSGDDGYYASSVNSGEIYFRRAVKIAEENPESDWHLLAQSKLSLADYYMYENNSQRARQVYADVWELLSADEDRLAVRREQLEDIVVLKMRDIPQFAAAQDTKQEPEEEQPLVQSEDQLLQGSVKVAFTISTRGRASKIFLLEAEPAEFNKMVTDVVREIRRRIYRPPHKDGVAVDSAEQRLEHKFFYRQSDLDFLRAEAAAEDDV